MATSPMVPPPPSASGPDSGAPPSAAPTSPTAASPSSADPSSGQGTQLAITVVNLLRQIAKSYPQTAPEISEANDIMRKIGLKMLQSNKPGEPSAPPT